MSQRFGRPTFARCGTLFRIYLCRCCPFVVSRSLTRRGEGRRARRGSLRTLITIPAYVSAECMRDSIFSPPLSLVFPRVTRVVVLNAANRSPQFQHNSNGWGIKTCHHIAMGIDRLIKANTLSLVGCQPLQGWAINPRDARNQCSPSTGSMWWLWCSADALEGFKNNPPCCCRAASVFVWFALRRAISCSLYL